ncbi:MAG: hypothetical protein ACKPKO_59940, partial [Candidatus Fonsibacter sp.]
EDPRQPAGARFCVGFEVEDGCSLDKLGIQHISTRYLGAPLAGRPRVVAATASAVGCYRGGAGRMGGGGH